MNVQRGDLLSISEHCLSCLVAAADEEEFNQGIILPPLIIQLKKILDQYPDDTQILKVSTSSLVFFPTILSLMYLAVIQMPQHQREFSSLF